MIDLGLWDDICRQRLDDTILDDRALDSVTLMLFGQSFATGRDMIGKMFSSYDFYVGRVKERLNRFEKSEPDKSVKAALAKAKEGFW